MNPVEEFKNQVQRNITGLAGDRELRESTHAWIRRSNAHGYTYNFS